MSLYCSQMDFVARGRAFEQTVPRMESSAVSKLFIILSVRKYPAAFGFTTERLLKQSVESKHSFPGQINRELYSWVRHDTAILLPLENLWLEISSAKLTRCNSRLERMIYSESASDCIALKIKGNLQQLTVRGSGSRNRIQSRIIHAFPA